MGILKGSVDYYITSKEDVLLRFWRRRTRLRSTRSYGRWRRRRNRLAKICAFIATLARFNAENQVRMGGSARFHGLERATQDSDCACSDRYDRLLRNLISDGQREGLIRADVNAKLAALAVMGMITRFISGIARRAGAGRSRLALLCGSRGQGIELHHLTALAGQDQPTRPPAASAHLYESMSDHVAHISVAPPRYADSPSRHMRAIGYFHVPVAAVS